MTAEVPLNARNPATARSNTSASADSWRPLASHALVVDGAMGTQLYERGVLFSACYEELSLSRPELVRRVHEDYVRAGAQIIETNSFGANAMRLDKYGLANKVHELNVAAAKIAREACRRARLRRRRDRTERLLPRRSVARRPRQGQSRVLRPSAGARVGRCRRAHVVETMRQTSEIRVGIEAALAARARPPASTSRSSASASRSTSKNRMADGIDCGEGHRADDEGVGRRASSEPTAPKAR